MLIEKLRSIEQRYKHWSIEQLALYLIGLQALVYLLLIADLVAIESILLIPSKIISGGEVWRIFTFILVPPAVPSLGMDFFFLLITWYVFYIVAQFLENQLGSFIFTLYCLSLWLGSIFMACIIHFIASKSLVFINPEVFFYSFFFILFLGFSVLNPDFEMLLFFVLPLKVKFLAYASAIFFVISTISAPTLLDQVIHLLAILIFVSFFYKELVYSFRQARPSTSKVAQGKGDLEPLHTCVSCGFNSITNPELEFRYRKVGNDLHCYCNQCRT